MGHFLPAAIGPHVSGVISREAAHSPGLTFLAGLQLPWGYEDA